MGGNNKRICELALLFLLLLASQEMLMRGVEGRRPRMCESPSHLFKGQCWSKSNCGHVCRNEGFHGGRCRGLRKRCFCTKPCHEYHPHPHTIN